MATIVKKERDGLKVKVKIERWVSNETAYTDGWNIDLGKKAHETTTISINKNGKTAVCQDLNFFYRIKDEKRSEVYARLGDAFISEPIYNIIKDALDEATLKADAENTKDNREEKIQAKKNAAEVAELETQRDQNPGWCNKCHSYCYGDCEAN